MSWINEIAGRAEDFLNKIDNGAATVLNKDSKKKKKNNHIFQDEVSPSPPQTVKSKYSPPPVKKSSPLHATVSSPNLQEKITDQNKEDERILNYLNDSAVDIDSLRPLEETKEPLLAQNHVKDVNINVEENNEPVLSVNLENENELLRNEVRSLNSEVSLLMARTKSSERELALTKSILSKKEGDLVVLEKEVLSLKQRFSNLERENAELYNENMSLKKSSLEVQKEKIEYESEHKLSQYQLEAQRKEEALKGDIASLRIRIAEIEQTSLKEKSEYAKELSEVNARLAEARKELEDYRAKAQWTLSEKEKLINELRKERSVNDSTEVFSLEIQQLQEEREKLQIELEEVRGKLVLSRKEELEGERRLEAVREEATAALRSAQARLAEETARRLAAEEHSTSHAEELHSVREELWRQVGSLNSRLKERERELSRLRRQLSERVVTRPEPELTAALVQKQEAIEQMTMEMNQLRLQLDRAKMSYGQDLAKRCQSMNVNDTDDAKAQLPSFMLHSRFDRSVKRAYSCVDRLSRIVFLRRHPFARILLLSYLVVLHTWLCFVLFSSTPDNR